LERKGGFVQKGGAANRRPEWKREKHARVRCKGVSEDSCFDANGGEGEEGRTPRLRGREKRNAERGLLVT